MSFPLENGVIMKKPVVGNDERKSFLANASFPKKLYDLVNTGNELIVRWEEHGRAFRIIDAEKFAEEVLPLYFRHSKLTSFQRQLNLYGFRRITKGEDQGSYYHAKFQRGKPAAVSDIRRLQGKAMPVQSGVNTAAPVPGVAYGNKRDVQSFDTSFPPVQVAIPVMESPAITQFECAVPLEQPLGAFDQAFPSQEQLPSGFGGFDDSTSSFNRNVSDFGWCNSGFEGLEDFDPLDMSLLDALFDGDDAAPTC